MDLDQARSIVRRQHHAVVTTMRRDGTPHMTPVLATVDNAGRITVSTRAGSVKVRNLRRDNRIWLCVLPDEFFGNWLSLAGEAEIIELPDALPLLEEYYRSISGEHDNWDDYRAAMHAENRVLVRVSLSHAGPGA